MRMRMRMLRQMAIQSHVLENLILGDSLALTVEAVDMLTARTATPVVLFPEHRVQFGFTFEVRVQGRLNTRIASLRDRSLNQEKARTEAHALTARVAPAGVVTSLVTW